MKLSAEQIAAVEDQVEIKAVPEGDEVAQGLSSSFGNHTFYLDPGGVYVFERASGSDGATRLALVKIADWTDDTRTAIQPIDPQPKNVYVKD